MNYMEEIITEFKKQGKEIVMYESFLYDLKELTEENSFFIDRSVIYGFKFKTISTETEMSLSKLTESVRGILSSIFYDSKLTLFVSLTVSVRIISVNVINMRTKERKEFIFIKDVK